MSCCWGISCVAVRADPCVALDYPPFFAYFSYLLTFPAKLLPSRISRHILELSSTPVEGWAVTGYMRLSVLITELVLVWASMRSVPLYPTGVAVRS